MTIEHRKFVCSDPLNNNNKFWEYKYNEATQEFTAWYGRVGEPPKQAGPKTMTRKQVDSKVREKTQRSNPKDPPYTEVKIVLETQPTGPAKAGAASKAVIKEAAATQLIKTPGDPILMSLIEQLTEANAHELYQASGGQMTIDLKTGMVTTPLGVLHKDNITAGRKHLEDLAKYLKKQDYDNPKFSESLGLYLRNVPQDVGTRTRGWHRNFITSDVDLQKQNTLLDQLEASADLADTRAKDALKTVVKDAPKPSLFNAEIRKVSSEKEISRITKMFKESMNSMHHHAARMRPIRFFEVHMADAERAYDKDPVNTNIWQLWHGTRKFNVLSILKNSLIVPKSGGSYHITGRMFGDGIYGSDQSTKALNYALGAAPGQYGRVSDNTFFMFLVDFKMGRKYESNQRRYDYPVHGYDSTNVKGGTCGVMNNEMIVYRESQVCPRFLIEFEER